MCIMRENQSCPALGLRPPAHSQRNEKIGSNGKKKGHPPLRHTVHRAGSQGKVKNKGGRVQAFFRLHPPSARQATWMQMKIFRRLLERQAGIMIF